MPSPVEKYVYTFSELRNEVESLRQTFDIVRLVSPENHQTHRIGENGLLPGALCYSFWNRPETCLHCPCRQIIATRGKSSRLESTEDRTYIVISKYVQLEEQSFSLEMITELSDTSGLSKREYALDEIRRLQQENSRFLRDSLTNCYSRHYMNANFHHYVLEAKSNKQDLCVAFVDMDNFKEINDRYGHTIGDEVLRSCCQFWLKFFDSRHHSFITRYGGDEFIITSIANNYEEFCRRIISLGNSMRKSIVLDDGQSIPFSFTIGCACMSELQEDEKTPLREALLSLADKRLYVGKHSGRNCIVTSSD